MGYQAFVTIAGQYEDTSWNYIDVLLESPEYDSIDDAERWHEAHHVKPWGAVAIALHANHPELVLIEAEYDIYEDGEPGCYDGLSVEDYYYNEALWWRDEETYWGVEEDRCL